MIIAVDTRFIHNNQPAGMQHIMGATLYRLVKENQQHTFLFISDAAYTQELQLAKNVQVIVAGPQTSNSLLLQYWYNYKIPALLRKHKADVFVSMEGICSLRTKKPQCLLVSDLSFLNHPQGVKRSIARFYKKHTPAFLAKAKSIVTVSDLFKTAIINQYKINEATVNVIRPGVDKIFKPLTWEEKEQVKEKYSEEKAYFLFSGTINQQANLINLLKAFSFFKKRQKSNMVLLIAGNADASFKKELQSYKYRNDVKLLENLSTAELATITAAAYALICPVANADIALSALQAMQAAVPVIISTGNLSAVYGNAAIYADPHDFKDIAEKMMLIFKDEEKARVLIEAGNALMQQYQLDKAADLLMQSILKAFNS